MNARPRISVVIPTRDYGRFLGCSIRSVLEQNIAGLEVIVADDGSKDNTSDVVSSFGGQVSYYTQPPGGTAAARNLGLRHAVGEFICFLDSDDAWVPGSVAPLLEILRSQPEVDAAYGLVAQVNDKVFSSALAAPGAWKQVAAPCWLAGGMVFRRTSFDRVGPFNENFSTAELVHWISEARDCGLKFQHHAELVLLRRIHGLNKVLTIGNLGQEYARSLRLHLARLRAKSSQQPE